MQLTLVRDETKSKTIVHVSSDKLVVSPFNPRRIRGKDEIEKLAQRIERNGFEITRALWVYPVNGHYEVFAGGNRLEAVKRTSIEQVPVVLHEGYTEDEITRLADQDNENDEYHTPVSVVDVWTDYKRLADVGWQKQRIADAKSVTNSTVTARLKYAAFPKEVLAIFFKNDFLKEGHAAQIDLISNFENLTPWLDRESAMSLVVESVLSKTTAPTAQQFKLEVEKINAVITMATEYSDKLRQWSDYLIDELARTKARTKADVQSCYNAIIRMKAADAREKEDEARRQASEAERQRLDMERQEEQARRQSFILSKLVLGDSREQIANAPDGIKLLLTDPPYGKDFQSNRRIIQKKAPKIANDDDSAFDLLRDVLTIAYPKMAKDSFALVWTDCKFYCEFKAIIEDCGFEFKTVIVWNKPNHGSGDLEGTPAPKHEWCIYAVKGNPKLNFRFDSVLEGNQFLGTDHPTEKPLDLLETLIKATTNEGDCVADPFFGGGSTPVTAYKLHRDFWGCEIIANWHSQATERIFNVLSK